MTDPIVDYATTDAEEAVEAHCEAGRDFSLRIGKDSKHRDLFLKHLPVEFGGQPERDPVLSDLFKVMRIMKMFSIMGTAVLTYGYEVDTFDGDDLTFRFTRPAPSHWH